jgi:hypothetical protein
MGFANTARAQKGMSLAGAVRDGLFQVSGRGNVVVAVAPEGRMPVDRGAMDG